MLQMVATFISVFLFIGWTDVSRVILIIGLLTSVLSFILYEGGDY